MRGDGSLNKAPAQRRTVFDMDAGGPTGSDMRGETFPVRQLGGRAMGTENGERTLSTGVKMMSCEPPGSPVNGGRYVGTIMSHWQKSLMELGEHRPRQDHTSGIKEQVLGLRALGLRSGFFLLLPSLQSHVIVFLMPNHDKSVWARFPSALKALDKTLSW